MNLKTVVAFLFVLATIKNTGAQNNSVTTHSQERLLLENQWLNTNNIAGAVYNPFSPDGNFALGYTSKKGDLKYAQLSPDEQLYSFSANKTLRVNNFVFTGNLGYQNLQQENVSWTARMNPVTDNPYMLADSISGLYNKDYIFLGGSFSFMPSAHISTGIKLNYMVANGARIKDPRPENDLFNLEIYPSFIYSFKKMKLGANLRLMKGREKVRYTTVETYAAYRFFRMFGLGKGAKTENAGNFIRNYYLSGIGGEIQAQYNPNNIELLTGIGYLYKMEKSEDGSFNPKKSDAGDFKENSLHAYIILNFGKQIIHSVKLNADILFARGIEFLQEPYSLNDVTYYRTIGEVENYSVSRIEPSLTYKLAKPNNDYSNKWEIEVNAQMNNYLGEYLLEAEESYTNFMVDINLNKYLFFEKNLIGISATGAVNYNLSNELKQLRTFTASQEIAAWNNIIQPDFNLNTSNIYALGAKLRYGRNISISTNENNLLYFDLGLNYMSGNNDLWSQHKDLETYFFKIGLTY